MTIWVNVSTAANWAGTPFGIVRVEAAIADAMQQTLGADVVRFCVWSRASNCFLEWKGSPSKQLLTVRPGSERDPVLGVHAINESQTLFKAIGRRMTGLATQPWPDGARALWRAVVGAANRRWGKPRMCFEGARPNKVGVAHPDGRCGVGCLRANDVFLTLGLEWESSFIPLLSEIKARSRIKVIGCIHDLIPIKYPQYCAPYIRDLFPEYLILLARSCDAIACVSENTLRDLKSWLDGITEATPRLFTIRLGAFPPALNVGGCALPWRDTRPFILFVSTLERRKNHDILYKAYHRLVETHGQEHLPRLIFVGAKGWGVEDLLNDIAFDPQTQGLIIHLTGVTDQMLGCLYENALFCLFPSVYEGWGLPVAEALGFGKPVICSERGAVPEVGGDLVDYVDPWDMPGWVRAIERLWFDEAYRRKRADRIQREYQRGSWSEAGTAISNLAFDLLEGKPLA